MRSGLPTQPSRRRPPRRQHPHQLHQQEARRRHQHRPRPRRPRQPERHWHQQQSQRSQGSQQEQRHQRRRREQQAQERCSSYQRTSSRALLVLLLLASSPLVLGLAEPPGATDWQQRALSCHQDQPKQAFGRSATLRIQPRKPQNLTIGYLTALKGGLKDRQGLAISGALSMALDEINNDPNILPNVRLVMRWSDTRGETVDATRAMIDMICEGVVAFFGPEGTCYVEAIVAQSRNIPMISYNESSLVLRKERRNERGVRARSKDRTRSRAPRTTDLVVPVAISSIVQWHGGRRTQRMQTREISSGSSSTYDYPRGNLVNAGT